MLGSPRGGADDGGLEGVFPLGSFRRKPIPLSAWVRSPATNAAVIGGETRGVSTDVSDVSNDPVEVVNSVWLQMLGALAYVVDCFGVVWSSGTIMAPCSEEGNGSCPVSV